MGIVITHRVCDIIAIDAPVEVSPPYAAGNTTVFNPNGVPYAIKVRYNVFLSAPIKCRSKINIVGSTSKRKKVAIYTFLFFKSPLML